MTTTDKTADTHDTVIASPVAIDAEHQRPGYILVGVDGSGCALHAARWAADEASRLNLRLVLVYAYWLHTAGYPGYNPYPARELDDLRDSGTTALRDAMNTLRRDHPSLTITSRLEYGNPVEVIRERSTNAALTVIGSHGSTGLATAIGSVAAAVAATNPVPVAVVHTHPRSTGPIIVGVDGTPNCEAAIRYAFDAASRRGVPVVAVTCWTDPRLDGPLPAYTAVITDDPSIGAAAAQVLADQLHPWMDTYPQVPVRQEVVHDLPAPGLLAHAADAQMIVVGSRRLGRISGMLLSSVSHDLIAHSIGTVVIAHPDRLTGPA